MFFAGTIEGCGLVIFQEYIAHERRVIGLCRVDVADENVHYRAFDIRLCLSCHHSYHNGYQAYQYYILHGNICFFDVSKYKCNESVVVLSILCSSLLNR